MFSEVLFFLSPSCNTEMICWMTRRVYNRDFLASKFCSSNSSEREDLEEHREECAYCIISKAPSEWT